MKVGVVCLLVMILGMIVVPTESYATHKSEKLSWQLVFLSSYPACSNYQYQMTNVYDGIAAKYLELYEIGYKKSKPICMSEEKYQVSYVSPDDLDLIIIVYDRNLGRSELHSKDIGGLYYHTGGDLAKNHAIVLCDCPNFRFSDPVWILTHELSHFALNYLNFDDSVTEDYVHVVDSNYDHCIEVDHKAEFCSSAKTRMWSKSSAYSWTVMKPYPEAVNRTEEITTVSYDNKTMSQMLKEITKWWANKKITDEDYENVLTLTGIIAIPPEQFDAKDTLFTDPPTDKKNILSNHSVKSGENLASVLSKIPFKHAQQKKASDIIPLWYSHWALMWIHDMINDEEFFNKIGLVINYKKENATDMMVQNNGAANKDVIYSYHWKRN